MNDFFEDLKFDRIENTDKTSIIIFKKGNKEFSIDNLSSGEKQIVYKAVTILCASQKINSGIAFIDEPELSMHPKWECKILQFYSNLLLNETSGIKQMFIATHSERILNQALFDDDAIVVGLEFKNDNLVATKYDDKCVLPYVSNAEVSFKIFGIYSNDLHLQLYDFLQEHLENTGQNHRIVDVDTFISNTVEFQNNLVKYEKITTHGNTTYHTLCTKIRNDQHHGRPNDFTQSELKDSIDLMYQICKSLPN